MLDKEKNLFYRFRPINIIKDEKEKKTVFDELENQEIFF
jgi:hypothetical protein